MKVKNWDKIKLNIDRNRDSNRDNPLAGRVFPYFSLKMHLFQERRVQSLYIELVWYKQRNPFTKLSYRYCTWSTCAVVSHAFTFICIRLLFSVRACVRAVCARVLCVWQVFPQLWAIQIVDDYVLPNSYLSNQAAVYTKKIYLQNAVV